MMGDVCGKGAQAASLTALARYTIRGASSYSSSPSDVLRALNNALRAGEEDDELRFCSVAFTRLRLNGTTVVATTASGGHPPPLAVSASGEVSRACPAGSLVGLFDDFEVHEETRTLAPGDVLALFTDGITEARGPDRELFGETRLGRAIATSVGLPAEAIAEGILNAVASFGGEATDDVALLVVRVPDLGQ